MGMNIADIVLIVSIENMYTYKRVSFANIPPIFSRIEYRYCLLSLLSFPSFAITLFPCNLFGILLREQY